MAATGPIPGVRLISYNVFKLIIDALQVEYDIRIAKMFNITQGLCGLARALQWLVAVRLIVVHRHVPMWWTGRSGSWLSLTRLLEPVPLLHDASRKTSQDATDVDVEGATSAVLVTLTLPDLLLAMWASRYVVSAGSGAGSNNEAKESL